MSDNNSLNEKYQKFESEEEVKTDGIEDNKENTSVKKEKKKKEPKEKKPKEKKAKEPKTPKEKKQKEPKEKKVKEPKEKKVKPPKEPKNKKHSHKKGKEDNISAQENDKNAKINEKFVKAYEEALLSNEADEKNLTEQIPEKTEAPVKNGRQMEEIVFEGGYLQEKNGKKALKNKKEKAPKEKKAKEQKEKKEKEPKPEKEKKPKKEKITKEKKQREPLQKKDIVTLVLSLVAVILVACTGFFAYFNSRPVEKKIEIVSKVKLLGRIFPEYVNNGGTGSSESENKLSEIQIARDGIFVNLVQTDFRGVFYGINSDYTVQYYQYSDSKIVPVKYTDTADLKVDMGSGILNIKMNYIKSGEYVSGISVFTSDSNNDVNYFYNFVVFKLTVLPQKYQRDGHALLLASTDKSALEGNNVLWTESFDVNLKDGTVTRFLSVINRNIDEKGAGVADFCILNKAGYTATTQKIPFISSREYPTGSGMQDVFVKNGNKEELLASNIYGKYLTADASTVVYLRKTTTGFDVVHNTDGEEKIQRSFYGFMDTAYTLNDKFLLSKEDGRLYNIVSGKDYSLIGYSMDVSSFIVSDDNRYVVMMGTVKNAVDYQIHIFDLQTGEYAKFQDKNYAPHGTLCFIDGKTVLYTAIEPNRGYEYVILDIEKAFNMAK